MPYISHPKKQNTSMKLPHFLLAGMLAVSPGLMAGTLFYNTYESSQHVVGQGPAVYNPGGISGTLQGATAPLITDVSGNKVLRFSTTGDNVFHEFGERTEVEVEVKLTSSDLTDSQFFLDLIDVVAGPSGNDLGFYGIVIDAVNGLWYSPNQGSPQVLDAAFTLDPTTPTVLKLAISGTDLTVSVDGTPFPVIAGGFRSDILGTSMSLASIGANPTGVVDVDDFRVGTPGAWFSTKCGKSSGSINRTNVTKFTNSKRTFTYYYQSKNDDIAASDNFTYKATKGNSRMRAKYYAHTSGGRRNVTTDLKVFNRYEETVSPGQKGSKFSIKVKPASNSHKWQRGYGRKFTLQTKSLLSGANIGVTCTHVKRGKDRNSYKVN